MKILDDLAGFAVLTSPLWLIMILLAVSIWVAVVAAKRAKRHGVKIALGLLVFLAVFFVPFGDEIVGRIYLNYLCATQAGVKVYQTVELPAEYWDERRVARFYRNFDSLLGKTYSVQYKSGTYSSFFHIDNAGYVYLNAQSGQVLGETIDYGYWGGWMRRNSTAHNTATGCINYTEPSNKLIDRIFILEHSK